MKRLDERAIEEDLQDLEHKLHRLRIEYDQHFMGTGRREPTHLRGDVQKLITRYASEPPRNTQLKFKFNALVARFQSMRALWGRTLREIEAGTYRGHRFRADLHDRERNEAGSEGGLRAPPAGGGAASGEAMDRLIEAFASAREKTGQGNANLDRGRLAERVREQARELRARHPGARVKFKVVIEGEKARLKASLG